ncbi:AAA family ATPase [Kribbella sp. NPDC051620]|uniref:helix-turn-helix transcriptional regulator n=1 Tax=Kribbella sp. NPDC051620 TaxID=3364120 RepID=UPI0037AD5DEB
MLIGRETERRAIERLVAGARVGSSGVLLITGEPGIGKTALVTETAMLAAGMRVLKAQGTEAEQELPFGTLLQLLRPALGELPRIPAPQRRALAAALALEEGAGEVPHRELREGEVESGQRPRSAEAGGRAPGQSSAEAGVRGQGRFSAEERFAVGAGVLSLVCRYAEGAPVVVLVDDAQWVDLPSAEALLFAARRLVADPIGLVIAARAGERHPLAQADLPELRLGGVGLAAAQELVAGLPVDLVASLHRTVAGNPLALIELARDPEQLQRVPPGVPVPVSALLADAFAARAHKLSEPAQRALLIASVEDGDLGVVARACEDLGVDVAVLGEGEQAGLIHLRDGRVEFRHPLVRSAIYANAEPAQRRAVHLAVANAVQDADRRAWHLSETVLGTDDAVAAALGLAGDHAVDRGAHAVAATAYERAARLTGTTSARALRLVAAGQAAWFAGMPERADGLLNEALTFDPPGRVRTQVDELRGDIAVKCGSPARARDILVAAAAETTDPEAAVGLLADVVSACFRLGDASTALKAGADLTELLPKVERPGTRVIGLLASGIAKVLGGSGGTEEIRQAIALAPSVALDQDRRRQIWMMLAPLFLREAGTGRALIEEAMRERRDRVAVGVLPGVLFHLARDDATTDRWADAAASYDEGVRLSRETGQTTELAINLAGLAWLSAHQGHEKECRASAAEAMRICAERQIHLGLVWSLFALGDLELGKGDPQRALPQYERLAEVLASLGVLDPDLSPAPELVEVYLRLGRDEDARRAARVFATQATQKGQPWAQARAARALGLVDDDEQQFQQALEWHARTLDAFELARTRLAYGGWLRRARRRVDAREQLREAVAAFDELGAPGWADQAAAELKATGETARRREPSTADDLTPQERQIALLLASGQSIRSVAARLFLSPKTVEYHLRKVYTKLGIHSRPELAEILEKASPD